MSNWDTIIPRAMMLERVWIPSFEKSIIHNAHVAMVIDMWGVDIALVAVWSLHVNTIHIHCRKGDEIKKGEKIWHFSLGSGIIILYPSHLNSAVSIWETVTLGQKVIC